MLVISMELNADRSHADCMMRSATAIGAAPALLRREVGKGLDREELADVQLDQLYLILIEHQAVAGFASRTDE